MGVAAGSPGVLGALAGVALAQVDAVVIGRIDQLLPADFQQAAVGRMGNCLLLHRGVDDHPLEMPGPDGLEVLGRRDGLRQQFLDPGLVEMVSVARQRRRITGQAGLEEHLAAEVLPVGVLQPALADRLVGEVVGVLGRP